MNEIPQIIFTRPYSEELREKLTQGESLNDYLEPSITYPTEATMQTTFLVANKIPTLTPDDASDSENSIKLYEFLEGLDKTQASDKRLWVYLSHVTFREYTMKRWNLNISKEELESSSSDIKQKKIGYINERWFLTGNARSLRRHSLARLWWAAYLTVAPWESDPEYFGSLRDSERYKYTKVLFSTQDIAQQILERKLGWSDKMLISILEYLYRNPEVAQDRNRVRGLMKELNLMLGYRNISALPLGELISLLEEIGENTTPQVQ